MLRIKVPRLRSGKSFGHARRFFSELPNREFKILFGSQTGNAIYFAQELAKEASNHAWKTEVVDLQEYNTVSITMQI